MNCAVHADAPVAAYCRTCGKPMCEQCKRPVRGVVYCEECLASRVQDTVPAAADPTTKWAASNTGLPAPERPPGTPSPGLATLLGFIPGVGAMYNGQFMKGFIHVLIFAAIIWMTDREGFFGIFIPFFIFYMVFDAYKTAHAREMGQPLPDPFGVERLFVGTPPNSQAPASATPGSPSAPGQAAPNDSCYPSGTPVGAVVLIALGVLFLLDNLNMFHFRWFGKLWPVILIVMGVWLFMRRFGMAGEGQQ